MGMGMVMVSCFADGRMGSDSDDNSYDECEAAELEHRIDGLHMN